LASLESRLRSEQAELAILQTKVPLAIKAGEANVNLTHAVLLQCENAEDLHRREVERLKEIEEPDDEVKRQLDDAEIAHEQAQQDVVVAQAAVERAESDLELARAGEDEIGTRIQELEALRTDRDNAEITLRGVQNTVTNMTVVSPGAGLIAARRAAVGEEAEPGLTLYEMVASDALCIAVEVSEGELAGVNLGKEAKVYLESAPDDPLDAKVAGVVPEAQGNKARWTVRLTTQAVPGRPLVLGMRADVVIRVRDDAKWVAPKRKS
jgi:HlyD family secretion protein